MKRGTIEHPKTIRLASALDIERWGAVGILESMWHFCAKHALRGDIGRWTDHEISAAIAWRGDPSVLINALCSTGWLDKCLDHRLLVHDWEDHAEESVKKTIRNRSETFAKRRETKRKVRPALALPSHSLAEAKPEPGGGGGENSFLEKPVGAQVQAEMIPLPESLAKDPRFTMAWSKWMRYWPTRVNRVSQDSAMAQLVQFSEWGVQRSIAAIEHSILKNYAAIHEPLSRAGPADNAAGKLDPNLFADRPDHVAE